MKIFSLAVAIWLALTPSSWAFLFPEDRQNLDLSEYKVTDPNASYFDIAARAKLIDETSDPQLLEIDNRLEMSFSCREFLSRPVIREDIAMPPFYDAPNDWRIATEANFAFEGGVSKLAGAWVATQNKYYAECLGNYLAKWAEADALEKFKFSLRDPQAWYAIESMIFAAALAYSTVRGAGAIPDAQRDKIEKWLTDAATSHFSTKGGRPSCCNNHFFRRSLYLVTVGVVTDNNDFFQTGISAVYSAMHDMDEKGALKLAMRRGRRAIHYQNYSLLYLTLIMQVAYRQGYDFFNKELYGRQMSDAVSFLMKSLVDPSLVSDYSRPEQSLGFTEDAQYVSWMEIWLNHKDDPRMQSFLDRYRPIYNRSAGGYMTFYFKEPKTLKEFANRQYADHESDQLTPAEIGGRYPRLELWRRSQ